MLGNVYLRSSISRKLFCSNVENRSLGWKLAGIACSQVQLVWGSAGKLVRVNSRQFRAASSLRDRQLASSVSNWLLDNQTKGISRRLKRPCLSWEPVEVILLVATEATAEEGEVPQE